MASHDSATFRYWQPRPLVQRFDTIRKESEEDLRASILEASEQQKTVVHKPSSILSTSITAKDERRPRPVHRVHDILRRRSRKIRHSFLSTGEPVYADSAADDAAQDAQSLRSAVSALTPANLMEQGRTMSPLSHFSDYATARSVAAEKLEPDLMIDLLRRPAKKEGKKVAKAQEKQTKLRERAERRAKAQLEDYERDELRRKVSEARGVEKAGAVPDINVLAAPTKSNAGGSKSAGLDGWGKTLLRLGTRSRKDKHVIPMPGDFSSKADLLAYLNPIASSPGLAQPVIAELPAGPPPYNPLESAELPNPNNASDTSGARPPHLTSLIDNRPPNASFSPAKPDVLSRPMICDACYAPIRSSQRFHHCAVCNGGDRIVCISCSDAGKRCRHELTERISSVKGARYSEVSLANVQQTPSSNHVNKPFMLTSEDITAFPNLEADHSNTCPSLYTRLLSPTYQAENPEAKTTFQAFEAFQRAEALVRKSDDNVKGVAVRSLRKREAELKTDQAAAKQRDEHLRLKERELSLREREVDLRDRECSLREQQAALRGQESASRACQIRCTVMDAAQPMVGCAAGEISRSPSFEKSDDAPYQCTVESRRHSSDLSEAQPHVAEVALANTPTTGLSSEEMQVSTCLQSSQKAVYQVHNPDTVALLCNALTEALTLSLHTKDNLRSHGQTAGTKRKASSQGSTSTASNRKTQATTPCHVRTPSGSGNSNDGEGDEDETSKRPKPETVFPPGAQRLLACPYAKYDPTRYSEQNQHEKSYRGCAVKYLTDISRLKQHLYRVHRRPEHHCARCFEVFKSKQLLDVHSRSSIACQVAECTFEEQFGDDKEKELRKKRPNKGIEDSWYFIYNVLFPDERVPESPYIDNAKAPTIAGRSDSVDEQTPILLEIFNEQLARNLDACSITYEQRELINQTLRQSMAELMQRVSPIHTPSVGQTPSILISPNSAQPVSTLHTPASSPPLSPASRKHSPAKRNTPHLSPLQIRSVENPGLIQEVQQMEGDGQASQDTVNFSRPTSASTDESNTSPMDFGFPVADDSERLLNEDSSMQLEDTIGLAVSDMNLDFDFGFQPTKFDDISIQRPTAASNISLLSSFVPPCVSSLVHVNAANSMVGADPSSLKPTCSKRSVDSGYGSMHSHAGRVKRDLNDAPPSPQDIDFNIHKAPGYLQTTNSEQFFTGPPTENIDYSFLDQGLYETLCVAQDPDGYGVQYWNGTYS